MPEENEQIEEFTPEDAASAEQSSPKTPRRKRFFNRRTMIKSFGVLVIGVLLLSGVVALLFKTGAVDSYVRSEFSGKMDRMGIKFDSEVFEVTAFPLELRLHNAAFDNKITGEKLFFIKDAKIGLTIIKPQQTQFEDNTQAQKHIIIHPSIL